MGPNFSDRKDFFSIVWSNSCEKTAQKACESQIFAKSNVKSTKNWILLSLKTWNEPCYV